MASNGLRGILLWALTVAAVIAMLAMFDHRLAMLAVVGSFGVALYARTDFARRRRSARLERDERRRRREDRELRLEDAGINGYVLCELTDIVDIVTSEAPADAKRYELDDLLDLYTDLLVASDTYERQLSRMRVVVPESTPPLQRAVRERAIQWRNTCSRRAATCNQLLIDVSELIRLYAERAMTPEVDMLFTDDIVGRQLASLEAEPAE